jgi:hypothetical protein
VSLFKVTGSSPLRGYISVRQEGGARRVRLCGNGQLEQSSLDAAPIPCRVCCVRPSCCLRHRLCWSEAKAGRARAGYGVGLATARVLHALHAGAGWAECSYALVRSDSGLDDHHRAPFLMTPVRWFSALVAELPPQDAAFEGSRVVAWTRTQRLSIT